MKKREQFGFVVVLKEGISREFAERMVTNLLLTQMVQETYYAGGRPQVHAFNPEHGGPVWYIP